MLLVRGGGTHWRSPAHRRREARASRVHARSLILLSSGWAHACAAVRTLLRLGCWIAGSPPWPRDGAVCCGTCVPLACRRYSVRVGTAGRASAQAASGRKWGSFCSVLAIGCGTVMRCPMRVCSAVPRRRQLDPAGIDWVRPVYATLCSHPPVELVRLMQRSPLARGGWLPALDGPADGKSWMVGCFGRCGGST